MEMLEVGGGDCKSLNMKAVLNLSGDNNARSAYF